MDESILTVHPLVGEALDEGKPVVALESTVITHGLPYPQNVATAEQMEASVRDGGATPATVAILGGQIHVGLTGEQLTHLGKQTGGAVRKCSRRDLPLAVARGEDGATTVAGTMVIAHLVGIDVFATGGIGGVHRGHPFDVSADLMELAQTPVTVVCSGAKAILDLPATREVLETHGVTVVGYGVETMPAFYARGSDLPVDARLDAPAEVAALIQARRALGYSSGLLVTVPAPREEALGAAEAEAAVEQAAREADERGLRGAATTPWLLTRVAELTGGRSLQANMALLRNNGWVAGQIAAALAAARAK